MSGWRWIALAASAVLGLLLGLITIGKMLRRRRLEDTRRANGLPDDDCFFFDPPLASLFTFIWRVHPHRTSLCAAISIFPRRPPLMCEVPSKEFKVGWPCAPIVGKRRSRGETRFG